MKLIEMSAFGADVGFSGQGNVILRNRGVVGKLSITTKLKNEKLLVLTDLGEGGVKSRLYDLNGYTDMHIPPGHTQELDLEGMGVSIVGNDKYGVIFSFKDCLP